MKKKIKYEKPVKLEMDFDEAIKRLSNVKKSEVQNSKKTIKSKK